MKPNSFATRVIRPRDQFEAWREWYQPVFDVISEQSTGDEFPAEIHLWKLGGVAVSRTVAPSIHIVRTKGHLRRDPVDHWVISAGLGTVGSANAQRSIQAQYDNAFAACMFSLGNTVPSMGPTMTQPQPTARPAPG
jgi:hypothetical protein